MSTPKKKTQPRSKSRRNFLGLIGGAGLAALAKIALPGAAWDVMKELGKEVLRFHPSIVEDLTTDGLALAARENWYLLNDIFGPFRQVVVSPANDNPALRGHRHDNDWRAALPFAAAIGAQLGKGQVLTSEYAKVVRGNFRDWDKVFLGGAISHPLARLAQGYIGTGYNLKWTRNFPQRLALWYEQDELTNQDKVMVYHSNSVQLMAEPIWEIRDTVTGDVYIPEAGRDRAGRKILKSNWLLITKAWEHEEFKPLVLSGGCHGVGTASLGLVLADRSLLGELANAVKPFSQWQALYRVTNVEYDDGLRRVFTTADRLKLERVCNLNIDPVEVNWPQEPEERSTDPQELIV